jgi:hypothetical protein
MFRIESGVTFPGEPLGTWWIANDALHGASTNLLMSAQTYYGHRISKKNMVARIEATGTSRVSPKPPTEMWQVRLVATLEDGASVIPRSTVFYWLRPVFAGSTPFLSVNGMSPCPADVIFEKIFAPANIPA